MTHDPSLAPNLQDPSSAGAETATASGQEISRVRDLSAGQWRSGIAAWLGWMFDGLDMHLYTLVAFPFVAELMSISDRNDPTVGLHASIIQGGFLVGWALGGGFFGRIGDRIGRSRALCLTILTYACFTGLSFFAQTWWQLFLFRFLSALGIGGEWAVGASLLSETWPRKWRPWLAAILQSGVNIGILLAVLANVLLSSQVAKAPRILFLIGIFPALFVLWVRRAVPEPEEWHAAKLRACASEKEPAVADLFRGATRRTTFFVIAVCAVSLTAHWAFMFWHQGHLRTLPDVKNLGAEAKNQLANQALYLVMVASILGNFFAALVAKIIGYRRAIALLCLGYFVSMIGAYGKVREHHNLLLWLIAPGFFQGLFALFTMYLPPLFPTLLRTTGAGFCYNIGRIVAAMGTVFFGLFSYHNAVGHLGKSLDYRLTLLYAGLLFLPAALIALFLPEMPGTMRSTIGSTKATD